MTNLKRTLINPALAGLRVHQSKVVGDGTWERIITEDEHHQLIDQLERVPRARLGREPKHLLSGIAKCGVCGEGLRHTTWKGRGNRRPSYACPRSHCCREATAMDAAIEEYLFRLIPILIAATPKHILAPNTKEAERKIRELENKIEEWRQAAIRDEVTPASFATIEKGILSQIEELRPKTPPNFKLPDPDTFRETWGSLSMRERRDSIRFLGITVIPAERRGARTGQLLIVPGWEIGLTPDKD